MNLTKKYYLIAFLTAPFYAMLIMTSRLPILVAFVMGAGIQVGFTLGGYYLGKREYKNDEQN